MTPDILFYLFSTALLIAFMAYLSRGYNGPSRATVDARISERARRKALRDAAYPAAYAEQLAAGYPPRVAASRAWVQADWDALDAMQLEDGLAAANAARND